MKFSRKMKIGIVAAVASLAIAGAAFAYFTNSGSGTASGNAGTSSALVLHGTVATAMYPGTDSDVTFTVDNASPGHQNLGTIHLVSVTTDSGHVACDMTQFTMPDVVAGQDLASGSGTAVTTHGTLSLANTANSQDACKLAPLTLNLTSN